MRHRRIGVRVAEPPLQGFSFFHPDCVCTDDSVLTFDTAGAIGEVELGASCRAHCPEFCATDRGKPGGPCAAMRSGDQ